MTNLVRVLFWRDYEIVESRTSEWYRIRKNGFKINQCSVLKVQEYHANAWLFLYKYCMDGFPSGQRGQTVNLLQIASVVRIHRHPLIIALSND